MTSPDTDFEDEVLAAMRGHENDAPTSAMLVHPADAGSDPRLPAWLAAAAAAAVVLAVGVAVAVHDETSPRPTSSHQTQHDGASPEPASTSQTSPTRLAADGAPVCPSAYPGGKNASNLWVPSTPQHVDTEGLLAPPRTPDHVAVCAYLGTDSLRVASTQVPLTGRRVLSGDLAAMTAQLGQQPRDADIVRRECPTNLDQADGYYYLVALTFGRGTMWVSVPGQHCDGASNGVFTTTTNLLPQADLAYTSGHWPVSKAQAPNAGRHGQETAMVPAGAVSVQVTRGDPASTNRVVGPLFRSGFQELIARLNSVRTEPFTSVVTCDQVAPGSATYTAVFAYTSGPDVTIGVNVGCTPQFENGSLQSVGRHPDIVTMLDQLAH